MQCEGTRPKSPSGKPMKVCLNWRRCPCECHATITSMFLMAQSPRRDMANPEYEPPINHFIMPSLADVLKEKAARVAAEQGKSVQVEESTNELIPDLTTQAFRETESGRTAKGQLEEWVERACGKWVAGEREEECTTLWVAEWIESEFGTLPSRGAIDAVWKRWVTIGFAITLTHPTQFAAFTPAGREKGRVVLREEWNRKNKNAIKAQALGRK